VQHAVVVEPDVRVGLAELGFQLVEVAFQLRLQSGEAVGEAGRVRVRTRVSARMSCHRSGGIR